MVHLVAIVENHLRVAAEALDILEHIGRRGKALRGVLFHRVHRDLFEPLRDRRVDARRRRRLRLHLHDRDGNGVVRDKRKLARQHFIQHDADGINIRLVVDVAAPRLLRRDIMHRADRFVGHRLRFGLREARDAEIHHLDAAVLEHHDILGLDVAVDDTALVRVLQSL